MRVHWLMAEALAAAGRHAEGPQEVDHVIDIAEKTGVALFDARLHQVRAELLLHRRPGSIAAVEASLRQALTIAQRQGAMGYELQAATRLARLWGERRKRAEAHDLLAPIYERFSEGFGDPILRDAKSLLDAL
jgi:predicted ATPase